jgi:CRP-like cAMP-binding protein
VVSEAFRRRLEHHGPLDAVNFHEPRVLRDKKLVDQELMLMSFGDSASQWYRPVNEDRAQLRRALERLDAPAAGPRRQGWEVLLWAKRVLQFNKNDQEARQALGRLVREDLQCRTDDGRDGLNPFFADLDPTLLREVVESAELVHRGYNEVLCRTGDEGDTMFVILRGRVGVYKKPGDESQVEPDYSHEEGEVVGELAFALAGNRTADLVALTETLLLAFNYNQLLKLLPPGRVGHEVRARVARFINHRALQHVSERVTFLVGPDGTGPLTRGTEPVQQTLAGLSWYCELIAMDRNQPITFEAAGGTEGIYLLAAGAVLDDRDGVLSAADFPVLWAALPGLPREQTASFTANSNEIKVLQIDAAGLERLDLEKLHALRASLTSR